jgi:hypothetical protein
MIICSRFALRLRSNIDFILPLSFLIVIMSPYLSPHSSFFPTHDTLAYAQVFYYNYQDYFLNGELPLWSPYNLYGTTNYYDLLYGWSPFQYLAAFLGKIMGIKDALQLYITSIMFEELAFLVGVYLLSRKLFENRLTVIFISFAAVGTVFWPVQLYWNFRLYYLAPFMLLYVIEFMQTGNFKFACLASLALMCSLIGNVTYFLPIYLLMLTTISLSFVLSQRRIPNIKFKSIFRADTMTLFAIVVLISIVLFYISIHSFDYTMAYTEGRNPDFSVSIRNYLSWGVSNRNIINLFSFLTPIPPSIDYYLYLSPTIILFLIIGMLQPYRSPQMIALIATATLLLLVSVPNIGVASVLYHIFPLMKFFRHLEHIRPLVKFLLIIAAGYGLDAAIRHDQRAKMLSICLLLLGIVIFLDVIGIVTYSIIGKYFYVSYGEIERLREATISFRQIFSGTGHLVQYFGIICAVVAADLVTPVIIKKHPEVSWVMLAAFALNMGLYQWYIFTDAPIHISRHPVKLNSKPILDSEGTDQYSLRELSVERLRRLKGSMTIKPYVFQNQRIPLEKALVQIENEKPLLLTAFGAKYHRIFACAGLDPCYPGTRVDLLPLGLDRLMRARLGNIDKSLHISQIEDELISDDVLIKSIGCNSPKLFLVERVLFAPDFRSAAGLIAKSDNLNIAPVVVGQGGGQTCDWEGEIGRLQIKRFSYNLLELEAQVACPCGAWLIYLDAFNPGWHATVNGKPKAILAANLAFKAVKLEPGSNRVSFRFTGNEWIRTSFRILFVFGVVFSIVLIAGACWLCFRRRD